MLCGIKNPAAHMSCRIVVMTSNSVWLHQLFSSKGDAVN